MFSSRKIPFKVELYFARIRMRFSQIVVNRQSLFDRGFRFQILFVAIAAASQTHGRMSVCQPRVSRARNSGRADGSLEIFNRFFDYPCGFVCPPKPRLANKADMLLR